MREIWVWHDQDSEGTSSPIYELIAKAQRLAGDLDAAVVEVSVIGTKSVYKTAPGADFSRYVRADGGRHVKANLLAEMAKSFQPAVILLSSGLNESFLSARAAAILGTGLCADCIDLLYENGELLMRRPAFGGGVIADIVSRSNGPKMATVRPGSFFGLKCMPKQGAIEWFTPQTSLSIDPVELISCERYGAEKNLSEAKIVVAGGLGIGSKEGFLLLEELAALLGGTVGATRAAVDAGYVKWNRQIGQTGATIHPDIYLAFGISGAVHHLAGINESKSIIAVNNDPKANIFDYADYAVVSDWKIVVQTLLNQYKK